jgi:hypothetical protein
VSRVLCESWGTRGHDEACTARCPTNWRILVCECLWWNVRCDRRPRGLSARPPCVRVFALLNRVERQRHVPTKHPLLKTFCKFSSGELDLSDPPSATMPATPAGISSGVRPSSKACRYDELEHPKHAAQLTAAGHAGLATPRTPGNREPAQFHNRRDSGTRRIEDSSSNETYDIRKGQTRGVSSSW